MYMSGGIKEKALKVSNDVVHIIELLRSNREQTHSFCCMQAQILMCLFFLYIISVAWVCVNLSLKQKEKVPMQI